MYGITDIYKLKSFKQKFPKTIIPAIIAIRISLFSHIAETDFGSPNLILNYKTF